MFFSDINSEISKLETNEEILNYLNNLQQKETNIYKLMRIKLIKASYHKSKNLMEAKAILNDVDAYLNINSDYYNIHTHYFIILGKLNYDEGRFDASLKAYRNANSILPKIEEINNFWNYDLEIQIGIISNYVSLSKNSEAITALKSLEKNIDPKKDIKEYIYVQNMLGYLHTKSKNYKEGTKYFNNIMTSLEDKNEHHNAYLSACNNLGYIYKITNQKEEAIDVLRKAIILTEDNNLLSKELLLRINLGFLLVEKENFEEAEQLGLSVIKKSQNSFEEKQADANRLLANVYYKTNKNTKALESAENAAFFFRDINDLKRLKSTLAIKNKILMQQRL